MRRIFNNSFGLSRTPKIFARYSSNGVRIGCASGFWGDSFTVTSQLLATGNTDYIVYDYLSEITMGLLAARKLKGAKGCIDEFILQIAPHLIEIKEKNIKLISNAGALDPLVLSENLKDIAEKLNIPELKVAVVTGDEMLHKVDKIHQINPTDLDTNIPFPDEPLSINAYLGAEPIAYALQRGADIVITGRCVDSALVLGPLMHEYGWKSTDWDLLAKGSLAGHILECGAQATGGICTDWRDVPDWDNIGYPIAEVYKDGSFLVTKPLNTGGIVDIGTVSEQIVYEIGNPASYLLPDVTCDFRDIRLTAVPDGVLVNGATGRPPSGSYKVCVIYPQDFRITAPALVIGPNIREKGLKVANNILKKVKRILEAKKLGDFTEEYLQVFGCNDSYGPHALNNSEDLREGMIWISCKHKNKAALELLGALIASAGTGMSPGLTNIIGGRPKPSRILKLFSFLTPKQSLSVKLHIDGNIEDIPIHIPDTTNYVDNIPIIIEPLENPNWHLNCDKLEKLAYIRSGDKGGTVNIGVVARDPEFYSTLVNKLTPEKVYEFFAHKAHPNFKYKVDRYTLPGIRGLNFVLSGVLGGGALENLTPDPQGKAFGQMLADLHLF
ncbi:hypothetical protein LOD99_5555 [Oopsacas minuta]|uniref:Terpene utilization protein AtuA n=1 Tax=Oopsacas minuta TaxID=111878 RepID=A0AAV7JQK5_9METZ|nr:hypothetical protein LOD99_5555 [Oopsacas minuta]